MAVRKSESSIDYQDIAQSEEFKTLLANKKKFIVPITIFFFIFFFALPIMTSYSTVLNNSAIGAISWAWVFAFAEFIMTWTLVTIYTRKANSFDESVNKILNKVLGRR